jgi:hypothetical protein
MVRDRAGRTARRKLIIRSVSERGLGAHLLGEAAEQLPSGTQVLVRLPGFGALLELPGRIVWSDRRGEAQSVGRIGIALFVEIVPAATRRLYGAWLAAIASRQPASPEGDERGHVKMWRAGTGRDLTCARPTGEAPG